MKRGLEVLASAEKAAHQLKEFRLLKNDASSAEEIINLGDPHTYKTNEYHRIKVRLPESARWHVFRLWQRETAEKLNEHIRELNRLGVKHNLNLAQFSPIDGSVKL